MIYDIVVTSLQKRGHSNVGYVEVDFFIKAFVLGHEGDDSGDVRDFYEQLGQRHSKRRGLE